MAKGCALSTGYLPQGGLPRNSVDRITDRPDMTSAVVRGRKASTQTNKQKPAALSSNAKHRCCYDFCLLTESGISLEGGSRRKWPSTLTFVLATFFGALSFFSTIRFGFIQFRVFRLGLLGNKVNMISGQLESGFSLGQVGRF